MKFIISGIIPMLLLAGCLGKSRPDVRTLRKPVVIERLDQDLFALDPGQPDITALQQKYGHYLDIYARGVLQLGPVADSGFCDLLKYFLNDSVMREVADTVLRRYPDLRRQEQELEEAWAYYRYYFPAHGVPEIYAHLSGFNQSVIVDSAVVGVGLDNYLGPDCIFYDMLAVPVPKYMRKKMTADDMVRDVMVGWLQSQFAFRPQTNDLISGMIYQGKIVYLLEKLFPAHTPAWSMGYEPEQWTWCENNESRIWEFLIGNEYIFSTQQRLIMKYLNDAPYTSGMPVESPGRVLVWTGYRMVSKYMERAEVSLEELMRDQDYHRLMRKAVYRP